jgi:translation elongation factor EF-Tu-like GTPase
MHCGLAKWNRSPGPDLPVAAVRPPSVPPHVQAEVRFLTTSEGGRESPVASGYRGQLYYDGHDGDAVYGFPGDDLIHPGATTVASLWLESPDGHRGKPVPGKSFEIREGRKVVARGVVTRLLALAEVSSA